MLGMIALMQGHIPNYTVIDHLEVWEAWRTLGIRVGQMVTFKKRLNFFAIKPTIMPPTWSHQISQKWMPLFFIGAHTSHPWPTHFQWWLLMPCSWIKFKALSWTNWESTSKSLAVLPLGWKTYVAWHCWISALSKGFGKFVILWIIPLHKTWWATWSQLNFAPCSWNLGMDGICWNVPLIMFLISYLAGWHPCKTSLLVMTLSWNTLMPKSWSWVEREIATSWTRFAVWGFSMTISFRISMPVTYIWK